MNARGPKFTFFDGEEDAPYDYGNRFFEQSMSQGSRLVVGPSEGHVQLMLSLAAEIDRELKSGEFYILFVLLLSRLGRHEPGRYQSNLFQSLEQLAEFMWSFQEFFESDGRHHVWIGHRQGTVVYDQHDVLFVYGPIERLRSLLLDLGFSEE